MKRRFVAACFVSVAAAVGVPALRARRGAAAAESPAAREARILERDLVFYWNRVHADPLGAADRSHLAALYLRRARATGSFPDLRRAEQLARESLRLRTARNTNTYVQLASALLGQHRFAEAEGVAHALVAADPSPGHEALLGEIALELGDYDSATVRFDSLWRGGAGRDLSVAPRLARWLEITGRGEAARRVLAAALAAARGRPDLPREQVAWFWLRVGDLALRQGRLSDAEDAFHAGLVVFPPDYRLLGAQARLAALRGRWRDAADAGERAIAVLPDPATLGLLSDAYAALGDTARSESLAKALETVVRGQPGAWHRAWSLFLLDHDRRVGEVLTKVREELRTRRDVYGYDLLAWALHKQGRDAEARAAMAWALAQGTRDAMLDFHAAEIARALGDRCAAERYAVATRAANPAFQPTHPSIVP